MTPYFETENGKLYCADCLEIMPRLEPVDLVLTDPPYGCNFNFTKKRNRTSVLSRGYGPYKTKDRAWKNIIGDDQEFNPSHLLPYPEVIIWGANYFSHRLPVSKGWMIWDKKAHTSSDNHGDCELAWTNLSIPIRRFVHLWRGVIRAGEENPKNGGKLHPAQKPIALIQWCLSFSKTKGIVLDSYLGSGTTAVACERINRRWIGIEISEEYCEIAKQRIINETRQLKLF
ncbi:MAG: DNA methyltransferase [Thermodesulfobacteriota bacterium]|nr:DNA methyltransferase [Thermodesulfobacteriota bacterium]